MYINPNIPYDNFILRDPELISLTWHSVPMKQIYLKQMSKLTKQIYIALNIFQSAYKCLVRTVFFFSEKHSVRKQNYAN